MSDLESSNFDNTSEAEAKRAFATNRLNERLDELMKENTTLRAQFEEAVNLTAQMEDLHKQNASLLAKLRDAKAENDDLNHRLEILVQKDRETSTRLQNEKTTSSSQRGTDLNSMNKEIEKIKAQSKAQIDSIYEQLEQAQQACEKENVEKRLLIRKLDTVINDASRYFEVSFKSIDDVLAAFKQSHSREVSQNTTTIAQSTFAAPQSRSIQQTSMVAQPNKDVAELQKKVRRLKKALGEKENQLQANEDEFAKINRDFDRYKKEAEFNLNNLNNDYQSLTAQMQRDAETYNHNISQFEAKISAMKAEMEKEKKKCKKANDERKSLKRQLHNLQALSPIRAAAQAAQAINEASDSEDSADSGMPAYNPRHQPARGINEFHTIEPTDQLIAARAELTEQLKQANHKKEQLAKLLQQKDLQIHEIQIETEKVRNELGALKTIYQETCNEVETLRTALTTREEAKEKIKETEPKEKQPNPRVVKLQKALEDQKQRYYQLQVQSDKKDTTIQQLQLDIKHLTQKVEEAEQDAERAHNETKDLRTSMINTTQPTAEDLIPPSAFRCNEFPPDLSSKVAKIANNHSLQPASKIQNSYKVIRKYFMQQVTMRDGALDEAYSENQTISNAVNQFLVDASIALDDQPVTFKDFFSQNAGKDLVEKITQIRADNASLHHENESMKLALSQLRETFVDIGDGYVQDPQTHILQIRDRLDATNADLQATSKKMRQYKSALKKAEQQAKKNEIALKATIEDLKAENETLSQHQETTKQQLQDLKAENQRLTVELSDVTHTREDLESTIIQEHDEQIAQATSQFEEQISNLKKQLRAQKATYDQLDRDYQTATLELNQLRAQVQALKAQKAQRDAEYNELQRNFEEAEKAAAERLEREKAGLTESFQKTIDQLHEQCENHRSDVREINNQLAEKEILVANLRSQIAKITKEKLKAINDQSQMKEQLKREQKLMETTIRSNKAQAESQYNARLEEYKNKVDSEKKNIYAYGVDAFREYFNPGASIDERSFKAVIDRAHERIVQLTKSDQGVRRMVGAGDNQTTEDAIAQLLL
ncbi:hypothetical protein TRFO_40634 [Tritrichomonas foetus]|uniref:Uncharacterized protein n=1 Tax=Tritrichomonas foetus TaxID=1144522 RepID=A0A1J4J5W0_9EUKA|nr:hypothetical protein [Tritrichomonas foetus]OHS93035.1 hypothetical protein TRFO_40634 [Tritrichomonas foetus]|eukprot:OHS93035.1 hypothetical protein TRFO_40634 [Tritrichomonas foetus]